MDGLHRRFLHHLDGILWLGAIRVIGRKVSSADYERVVRQVPQTQPIID